jgi:hypothetical protein
MRNLLLFSRFSGVASNSMKDRIDQLRALLPTQADGKGGGGSRAEKGIFKTVERVLLSQPGCTVESNLYLDGCFEADIVITRVSPDGSKSVYNIEVDGPSHSRPIRQRLHRRRDQHLQEACGVRIARIPLVKPTGKWLQGGEYEAAVREVLERLQLLQLPPADEADSKAANHRNAHVVVTLSSALIMELSKTLRVDNEGDEEITARKDPFLAAATSKKWRVSGKKRYLKEFYEQVDHRTIDKARLVSKLNDPAGYMTLIDMLRDSWAKNGVSEEELQGIIDKYSA